MNKQIIKTSITFALAATFASGTVRAEVCTDPNVLDTVKMILSKKPGFLDVYDPQVNPMSTALRAKMKREGASEGGNFIFQTLKDDPSGLMRACIVGVMSESGEFTFLYDQTTRNGQSYVTGNRNPDSLEKNLRQMQMIIANEPKGGS